MLPNLSKQLDDLAQKMADLANKQLSLQSSVQFMSFQLAEPAINMDTDIPTQSPTQVSSNTLDILN